LVLEQRTSRPVEVDVATDEEGTSDIYKSLIQLLHQHRQLRSTIKQDIKEKASFDWRAEHNDKYGNNFKILASHFGNVRIQHSFVPRIGELVLWCPDHPDDVDIMYNPEVGGFQFYSMERQNFHGFPRWRGGVITQSPSSDSNIDVPDVLHVGHRKDSLNRAGFRVETFPDVNNHDKSASKQYKYVPLRQIRPLNHWQMVLRGIPKDKLDPSVLNAVTCMVTVSLLEKYRLTGCWPDATIHCKGIYIGAELLIEGDAVRILPSPKESSARPLGCTDVLVISSIRLQLYDITEEHIKINNPHISTTSSITLVGTAYTLDPSRAYVQASGTSPNVAPPQPIPSDVIEQSLPIVGATAYGNWYALHNPQQKIEISHDRVLGRLYESDAMSMWTGTLGNRTISLVSPSLSYDLASVLSGRRFGSATDERISNAEAGAIHWHWADTRVMALSLETVNGLEVGPYHSIRDARTLQAWRARLKIIDGVHTSIDTKESMLSRQKGRPKGSRMVNGMLVVPDGSESDEVDPPIRGSFSEAARSKGVGGMVGAGAALEEDDDDEDREGELENDDTGDDNEPQTYSSTASIKERKPDWESTGFIIPEDPDVKMRDRLSQDERSPSPELRGLTKARKSTGRSKFSSSHAGRYDNSITPAMTQEIPTLTSTSTFPSNWKGKGRAEVDDDPDDPDMTFRSVKRSILIPLDERSTRETDEEGAEDDDDEAPKHDDSDADSDSEDRDKVEEFYVPANFPEPEPKDDDDYHEDEDGDGEEEEEDEGTEEGEDDEAERMRTLAIFRKQTFDRAGREMLF
jgi:Transcription-silencing protein Clr2